MPSEQPSEVKFEIGHVLFIDIVGYSKLLINQQSEQLETLKSIVRGTEQFKKAEADGKLLRLPTGDGGALVFRTTPEAPVLCALEIAKALKAHSNLKVRMGIHSGPVNEITDLNEQANIAGAGINLAQRVMDCGDAGHILLSRRVAEDLEHYRQWQECLHDLGDCEVKHGVRLPIVNLYCDGAGNPQLPKKFYAYKKRQSRGRRAALATAFILLAAVVGAFLFVLHKPTLSVPVAPEKSIAVLPFENLSQDPDNAYFADGVQEEILTRLSKIADLKVISRTSTQRYKTAPPDLSQVAKQLHVAHVLEGTVQKAVDQVRVNVQLIDARTDTHIWADKFDRKLTDVFAVESEIAGRIAHTLQAKLTASEQQGIAARPTSDVDAHQLYLRGRYFWSKQTGPDLEKSIDYFNQAIARDPNYAVAYAGLSDCYRVLFFWEANPTSIERRTYMEKARASAEKALKLDDTLGEAHESLAGILFLTEFNIDAAKREFERALELNPNDATAHQWFAGTVLQARAELERAVAEIKRAVELDPFSPFINANCGYILMLARRYPEAIVQCQKAIELDPNYYLSHQNLAQTLELTGRINEAIAEYEKPHGPSHEPYVLAFRTHIYGMKGDRTKARELLNELKQMAQNRDVWPFGFALAYLGSGDKDEAIRWLERSYQQKEYELIALLKVHPMLDPLRAQPRFQALVRKIFEH